MTKLELPKLKEVAEISSNLIRKKKKPLWETVCYHYFLLTSKCVVMGFMSGLGKSVYIVFVFIIYLYRHSEMNLSKKKTKKKNSTIKGFFCQSLL